MKREIPNPYPGKECFFCGSDNSHGLKLKCYWDEESKEVSTEYIPARHFVGLGNILHGGIQMGILDELMGWTSYVVSRQMAVTTNLQFQFIKPVYITGKKIVATCRVTSEEGPQINMQATLSDSEGTVCTTAKGTFHLLRPEKFRTVVDGENCGRK